MQANDASPLQDLDQRVSSHEHLSRDRNCDQPPYLHISSTGLPLNLSDITSLEKLRELRIVTNAPPVGGPGPIGLFGFAVVTFLASAVKFAGARENGDALITGVGFLLGGVLQLVAGFLQYAKNNTHSATAFSFFGAFWTSQALIVVLQNTLDFPILNQYKALSFVYNALLAVVTFILFVPTIRMNRVLSLAFAAVFLLYVFDAVAIFTRAGEILAGVCGVVAAVSGFYLAAVDLWNETWGKEILPTWPHTSHRADYTAEGFGYLPRIHFHKSSTAGPQV